MRKIASVDEKRESLIEKMGQIVTITKINGEKHTGKLKDVGQVFAFVSDGARTKEWSIQDIIAVSWQVTTTDGIRFERME